MFRSGSSGRLRPRSLRFYLAVLLLAALLPMAGAAAFVLWRLVQGYRAALLLPLQESLRTLAPMVLSVVLVALGVALVLWVARRVLHPVQALAHNAEALRASEACYRQLSLALAQEKERLELATLAGGVGIMERDFAEDLYLWDAQTHAIFGLQRGGFDGSQQQLVACFHPDDLPAMARQWQVALQHTSVLDMELRIVQPGGAVRTVQIHGQIHRHADGSPARAIGTVWDVTAERDAADALTAAKEAAEAAERGKSAFLAFMGHEIRTPMNTVLGMTRLVLQTELSRKQRNYLEKIDLSAQLLLGIVNDLLDLSKIEAGKLALVEDAFSLESLLESVSVAHALKAEEKGLELAYAVHPDVPAWLVGDALRLTQVLGNLVGNAVKFTAQGEVVVSVALEGPPQPGSLRLRFAVRDTGLGLDAAQIARMFLPFSQADNLVSRSYGGTGLGLSICKQLVDCMGGSIGVHSAPGVGSTFSFGVPLGQPQPLRASWPGRNAPALQQRRLLVVDDNPGTAHILAQLAGGFGMVVQAVASGSAALCALRTAQATGCPFALVLMDGSMPGMGGMQTARLLQADGALATTPVVLMATAYAHDALQAEALGLGLAGVLVKPVTETLLFQTLANALGPAWAPPPQHSSRRPLDLGRLYQRRALVVADHPLGPGAVGTCLQQMGMQVVGTTDSQRLQAMAAACDVVLVEHPWPGIDRLAAIRTLGSAAHGHTPPILALTGEPQACRDAGAHDCQPLAWDADALARMLLDWLPPDPALAALAGLRVLVVDDNALNREVASEFLLAVHMQVVLAADGLEALDCLNQGDFDMVLMDLQMPGMDGLSASREIRKQARWARLPLIALTAHDAQMGHPATVAVGMDAYLGKPIDEAMLYQTLLQFVTAPASTPARPPAVALLPGPAEAVWPAAWPGLDLPLALSRLGGHPASLQRVLQGFLRDFSELPAQWQPALAMPPRQGVARQAHTLKSSASYLGADALAAAARHLEQLAAAAPPEVLAPAMAGVCRQLAPVLDSVASLLAQHRHTAGVGAEPGGPVNVAALLACIAQARPLVAQGNYAAVGLLDRIRDGLAPTALARLAHTAWTQFEDLNLPAASKALEALNNALEDPQKDAP